MLDHNRNETLQRQTIFYMVSKFEYLVEFLLVVEACKRRSNFRKRGHKFFVESLVEHHAGRQG